MSTKKSQTTYWKEKRRCHAQELAEQGWKQRDIAVALDVSKGAVSQWLKISKQEGRAGLLARAHTGRSPELADEQKLLIPDYLSHGAESYGFQGEVWTCRRVRKMIEIEFGVSYHKSHVARLLKELNWTPQQPVERATQRNEEAIADWRKQVWSDMKKKRVWNIGSLFLWMNRAFTSCQRLSRPMHLADKRLSCECSKLVIICPS
jgi:transposase